MPARTPGVDVHLAARRSSCRLHDRRPSPSTPASPRCARPASSACASSSASLPRRSSSRRPLRRLLPFFFGRGQPRRRLVLGVAPLLRRRRLRLLRGRRRLDLGAFCLPFLGGGGGGSSAFSSGGGGASALATIFAFFFAPSGVIVGGGAASAPRPASSGGGVEPATLPGLTALRQDPRRLTTADVDVDPLLIGRLLDQLHRLAAPQDAEHRARRRRTPVQVRLVDADDELDLVALVITRLRDPRLGPHATPLGQRLGLFLVARVLGRRLRPCRAAP